MANATSPILAIDIGNTRTHWALFEGQEVAAESAFSTADVGEQISGVLNALAAPASLAIRACSVVPSASLSLRNALAELGHAVKFLTADCCEPLRIHYPDPSQIGPDRLANAIGAISRFQPPLIVIDMGTAVTFDIVSQRHGYEGGVIGPGFALLADYLAEKTALLPRIDLDQTSLPHHAIGKSTRAAMEIGCVAGFSGMIREILAQTTNSLRQIDQTEPTVLVTGGTYRWFQHSWLGELRHEPRLTLEGLRAATHLQ